MQVERQMLQIQMGKKEKTSTGCAYITYPQSLTLLLYFLSISKNNVSKH